MAYQGTVIEIAHIMEMFEEMFNEFEWDSVRDSLREGPDDMCSVKTGFLTIAPIVVMPIHAGYILRAGFQVRLNVRCLLHVQCAMRLA